MGGEGKGPKTVNKEQGRGERGEEEGDYLPIATLSPE